LLLALLCEYDLRDSVADYTWLYRGVPAESPEVEDVDANGAVCPRRPGNIGDYARYCHSINEMTDCLRMLMMKTMTGRSPQKTWLGAIDEAARLQGLELPSFNGYGMGALRSATTASGRFVTL
jgi:hypothetical protein